MGWGFNSSFPPSDLSPFFYNSILPTGGFCESNYKCRYINSLEKWLMEYGLKVYQILAKNF